MDQGDDDRSWADICDEELYENTARRKIMSESLEEGEIRDVSFIAPESKKVYESIPLKNIPSSTPSKLKSLSPAAALTSSERAKNNAKPIVRNALSYAKVLSQGASSDELSKEQPNLHNDDLSLTSHLDVFHVDSPQKKVDDGEPVLDILIDEDTMFSPCKPTVSSESVAPKNTKRPFLLIDSPAREARDRAFHFNKIAKSEVGSDVHTSNIKSTGSSPSSRRELEVNPDVLCRRQKQIDYGKNTLGYEQYLKLVPKQKRTKGHPKTPPKQLKMSRRAWDGLIKNWRMKLHKWDPVSETDKLDPDNANSDQFSFSSEDPSSYDSSSIRSDSTVSTPKKCLSVAEGEDGRDAWSIEEERTNKSENSKKRWTRRSRTTDKSDDDDYLGCEPLTENCLKACS